MILQQFMFTSPFYLFFFVFIGFQAHPTVHGQSVSPFDAGDAFDHPHEEGDEHVVNREVCSKEDLPDEIIDSFDRCTNFIPVYRQLNLLKRCRDKIFNGTNFSKNDIRKAVCFNSTMEHLFNGCMTEIKEAEGPMIQPPNPLQTMDFMFCMKTIAIKRMKNVVQVSSNDKGCESGFFVSTRVLAEKPGQEQGLGSEKKRPLE